MDRKEFLKRVCGIGACGCAAVFFNPTEPLLAEETVAVDGRLAFARHQIAKMVGFMAEGANGGVCAGVIEKTGRECAKLGQLQAKYRGDPEGYFAAAKKNWGTDFSWDKEKGVITVTVPEGECGCPMVDNKKMPAVWCNCSVGYQKETFETVFGKPVQASLKVSKLGGGKRCVFEVRIS